MPILKDLLWSSLACQLSLQMGVHLVKTTATSLSRLSLSVFQAEKCVAWYILVDHIHFPLPLRYFKIGNLMCSLRAHVLLHRSEVVVVISIIFQGVDLLRN